MKTRFELEGAELVKIDAGAAEVIGHGAVEVAELAKELVCSGGWRMIPVVLLRKG